MLQRPLSPPVFGAESYLPAFFVSTTWEKLKNFVCGAVLGYMMSSPALNVSVIKTPGWVIFAVWGYPHTFPHDAGSSPPCVMTI